MAINYSQFMRLRPPLRPNSRRPRSVLSEIYVHRNIVGEWLGCWLICGNEHTKNAVSTSCIRDTVGTVEFVE